MAALPAANRGPCRAMDFRPWRRRRDPHIEAILAATRTGSLVDAADRLAREPRIAEDVFATLLAVEPAGFPAADDEVRVFLPASAPALPPLHPQVSYYDGPRFRGSEVARFIGLPVGHELRDATEWHGRRVLSTLRQPLLLSDSVVISNPITPLLQEAPGPNLRGATFGVDPAIVEGYVRLLIPLEAFLREGVLQLVDDRHSWSLQMSMDTVWAPATELADAAAELFADNRRRSYWSAMDRGRLSSERDEAAVERVVDGVLQLAVAGLSNSVSPLTLTRQPWTAADPFRHGRAAASRRAEELLDELLPDLIEELGGEDPTFGIKEQRASAEPLQFLASVRLPRLNLVTDKDLLEIRRNDDVWAAWRRELTSSLNVARAADQTGGDVANRIIRERMQASAADLRAGVLADISLKKRLSKIGAAFCLRCVAARAQGSAGRRRGGIHRVTDGSRRHRCRRRHRRSPRTPAPLEGIQEQREPRRGSNAFSSLSPRSDRAGNPVATWRAI